MEIICSYDCLIHAIVYFILMQLDDFMSIHWVTIHPTNGLVLVRHQSTTRTNTNLFSIGILMNKFKLIWIYNILFEENTFENVDAEDVGHFVQPSRC